MEKFPFLVWATKTSLTACAIIRADGGQVTGDPHKIGIGPGELGLTIRIDCHELPLTMSEPRQDELLQLFVSMLEALYDKLDGRTPKSGLAPQVEPGTILSIDGKIAVVVEHVANGLWLHWNSDYLADLEELAFVHWEKIGWAAVVQDREELEALASSSRSARIREAAAKLLQKSTAVVQLATG